MEEVYGYFDPVYNFKYISDSIELLDDLIISTADCMTNDNINCIFSNFDQGNFENLRNILDIIFLDIENKKIDLILVQKELIEVILHKKINFIS